MMQQTTQPEHQSPITPEKTQQNLEIRKKVLSEIAELSNHVIFNFKNKYFIWKNKSIFYVYVECRIKNEIEKIQRWNCSLERKN